METRPRQYDQVSVQCPREQYGGMRGEKCRLESGGLSARVADLLWLGWAKFPSDWLTDRQNVM